jgi:hypothetical protein
MTSPFVPFLHTQCSGEETISNCHLYISQAIVIRIRISVDATTGIR